MKKTTEAMTSDTTKLLKTPIIAGHNMKNPCQNLRVERHPPVLSKMFTRLLADAVGKTELQTKKLFNIK